MGNINPFGYDRSTGQLRTVSPNDALDIIGSLQVQKDQNASTRIVVTNATSGTAALAGFYLVRDGTAGMAIDAVSAANSDALTANCGKITTDSALTGLVFDAGSASGIHKFAVGGAERWRITSTSLLAITDNSYDIGASGATRPRTGYFGTSLVSPSLTNAGTLALSATGANVITFSTASSERLRLVDRGDLLVDAAITRTTIDTGSNAVGVDVGRNNGYAQVMAVTYSATAAHSGYVGMMHARGTATTPTASQAGDVFGVLAFGGYGATSFNGQNASIRGIASQTWTGSAQGTYLSISTTSDGSASATERWQITAAGHLIGGTDNTYDIGASGATRPRTGYFGTSVIIGSTVTVSTNAVTGSGALSLTATAATLSLAATGSNVISFSTASTEFIRINSSGDIAVGTAAITRNNITGAGQGGIEIAQNSGSAVLGQVSYSATIGHHSAQYLMRARGSATTPTAVQGGDSMALIGFGGYDGGGFQGVQAGFQCVAVGTWGVGTNRGTEINVTTTINGGTVNTNRWKFSDAGHFLAAADNTYDVGASGATRPRTGYFGTSLVSPSLTNAGTLAISATGANSVQIQPTANTQVVIGTTTPTANVTLDVSATTNTPIYAHNTQGNFIAGSDTASYPWFMLAATPYVLNAIRTVSAITDTTLGGAQGVGGGLSWISYHSATNNTYVAQIRPWKETASTADAATSLIFSTHLTGLALVTPTDQMRLDSTGALGLISTGVVGFTSGVPTAALDVGISRSAASTLVIGNGTAGNTSGILTLATVNAATSVITPLVSNAAAIQITTTASNGDITLDPNGSGVIALSANITTTGKVTNYNSVATAGQGVPSIYGSGRVTAQTAAVASVATYTVGAADGSFDVAANVNVTTSTTHDFTATVSFTDETNAARTVTLNFLRETGAIVTNFVNGSGAIPYFGIPIRIRCKASTAITIATTGTFTSVTYNVEGDITQVS